MKRAAIGLLLAASVAAGCATIQPVANESLVQAREAYSGAQANPHVTRFAPEELALAGQALTRAEQLASGRTDDAQVAHQAYIAEQRAHIAQQVAMARAAEAEIARAEGERERAVLAARAREAEAAAERARARLQAQGEERAVQQDALRGELARLESQIAELKANEDERGTVITLGTEVLFDTGEATLKPGARRALEEVARFVRGQPERAVVIEGFTDTVGPDDFNQRLSERRAQAVRQVLIGEGVPAGRITARGLGESYPIASNTTAAGRQLNRRVEIVLPREGGASVGRTAQ